MYQAFLSGKTPTSVSNAEELAEIVSEAVTDNKKPLRYVADRDIHIYVNNICLGERNSSEIIWRSFGLSGKLPPFPPWSYSRTQNRTSSAYFPYTKTC
jgi:hypothetical protein